MTNDQIAAALTALDHKLDGRFAAIDQRFEMIDQRFEHIEKHMVT